MSVTLVKKHPQSIRARRGSVGPGMMLSTSGKPQESQSTKQKRVRGKVLPPHWEMTRPD